MNFSSFFLNLDNIIIKLVNIRGTMRKEAEVNHAYVRVQEPVFSFFALPGIHTTQLNWPLNGSENVGFKMNSRFFNLCRVFSNLKKMASVGEFPWSWLLEDGTQV